MEPSVFGHGGRQRQALLLAVSTQHPNERLQPLVASLLADLEGYTVTAPVINERELHLDGFFLPPREQL